MNKIAIFVEGQTEQLFVRKLLEEIAGKRNIAIESLKTKGGGSVSRTVIVIQAADPVKDQRFYALVVDCGSDSRVASEIRDSYNRLIANGYQSILGIRDVYPKQVFEIPIIQRAVKYRMPTKPFAPDVILATMEVEAWFLAEHSHFERIDVALTLAVIKTGLGLDVPLLDVEARTRPSDDLHNIYAIARKAYKKDRKTVQRTVDALDYTTLYLQLPGRVPSLGVLVGLLDRFFTPGLATEAS